MIKNECEIVRDLMPNYIENQISDKAKEFVEEHLVSCKECKEIVNTLQVENQETSEDREIDFLKKYNRKMNILKIVASILIVVIVSMCTILSLEYMTKRKEDKKTQYISEIMDKAYLKIEDIKQEILNGGNYKVIEESTYKNYVGEESSSRFATFYKDLNYREESNIGEEPYTNYGVILGKDNRGYIKHADVQFDSNQNYKGAAGHGIGLTTNGVLSLGASHSNPLYKYEPGYENYDIMEEIYDGKEYYIVRRYTNNISISYIDTWIRKEDMLLTRIVVVESKTRIESDTRYTWEANSVTDEDIKIRDERAYNDLQNEIREFKAGK